MIHQSQLEMWSSWMKMENCYHHPWCWGQCKWTGGWWSTLLESDTHFFFLISFFFFPSLLLSFFFFSPPYFSFLQHIFVLFSFLLHLVIFPHFVPDSLLDPFFIQLCVHCVCYDQRTEHITRLIETLILSLSSTSFLFFLVHSISLLLSFSGSSSLAFESFFSFWQPLTDNPLESTGGSISRLIKSSSKERRKKRKRETNKKKEWSDERQKRERGREKWLHLIATDQMTKVFLPFIIFLLFSLVTRTLLGLFPCCSWWWELILPRYKFLQDTSSCNIEVLTWILSFYFVPSRHDLDHHFDPIGLDHIMKELTWHWFVKRKEVSHTFLSSFPLSFFFYFYFFLLPFSLMSCVIQPVNKFVRGRIWVSFANVVQYFFLWKTERESEKKRRERKKKKERMRWMSPSSYINNGHMDESLSFPSFSCHQGVDKHHQVRTYILMSSRKRGNCCLRGKKKMIEKKEREEKKK